MESEMKTEGIAELDATMAVLIKNFPKEKLAFMRKQAQELRKFAKKYAKKSVKKRTGNLFKGIDTIKPYQDGSDTCSGLKYKKPAYHGHLIELAHKQVGHSPNKIYSKIVKGRYILVRAKYLFAETFEKNVESDLADFIVKKLEKK